MGLFSKASGEILDADVSFFDLIGQEKPVIADTLQEYYFHYFGKMNQGHILETPEREPIFASEITKFKMLGNSDFEFVDYVSGIRVPHLIGKAVTYGGRLPRGEIGIEDLNWDLPIDGKCLLDLFKEAGFTFSAEIKLIQSKPEFSIGYEGHTIGLIKGAGTAILPNVKSNRFTENVAAPGLYKVYTSPENAKFMFLWCLYLESGDSGANHD